MKNPEVSLIAAISQNNVIGKDGELPWHISEDLKRFKKLTTGHVVIMGRKTFESVGRPLPNRTNILVTRDPDFVIGGCLIAHSLEEALDIGREKEENGEIFIIGGGQIYSQSMQLADKLYLTIVEQKVEGDVFFPDYSEFKKVVFEQEGQENGLKYKFIDLEKS